MRHKKSQLFNLSLIIVTIVVFITAMFFIGDNTEAFRQQVGVRAFNILDTYQWGEKFLIYVDQAAKYSAFNAVYGIADNGGFIGDSECGRYIEYNLLSNADGRECVPDYEANLEKQVLENLNKYLDIYPVSEEGQYSFKIKIKKEKIEYDLLFNGENLIGTTMDEVTIEIYGKPKEGVMNIIGTYDVNPSFNVDVGYDIRDYDLLISQASTIYGCRTEKEMAGLIECVKKNKPDNWQLREDLIKDERVFAFDVNSSYKLIKYDETDRLAYLRPVVYKFAIYFPTQTIVT